MATKKAKKSPAKAKSQQDTLLDKVVLLGSSLAYLTKGATDELIDTLEKNKVISTKEGKAAVEKAKAQLKLRQADVKKTVANELGKVIDQLGLATKKDLEALKKKSVKKAPKKSAPKKAASAKGQSASGGKKAKK